MGWINFMFMIFLFCRFRIDNTDHIIDVNRDNLPYDQVNIICPVYAPGTKEEDAEKYIIYNVSPPSLFFVLVVWKWNSARLISINGFYLTLVKALPTWVLLFRLIFLGWFKELIVVRLVAFNEWLRKCSAAGALIALLHLIGLWLVQLLTYCFDWKMLSVELLERVWGTSILQFQISHPLLLSSTIAVVKPWSHYTIFTFDQNPKLLVDTISADLVWCLVLTKKRIRKESTKDFFSFLFWHIFNKLRSGIPWFGWWW